MVEHITMLEDFENKVEKANKTVIVDFYAVWCGPCKMFAPIMDKVSEEYPNVDFYKVNVEEAQEIAMKFQIRSIPTIIRFDNGEATETKMGAMSASQFKEFVERGNVSSE